MTNNRHMKKTFNISPNFCYSINMPIDSKQADKRKSAKPTGAETPKKMTKSQTGFVAPGGFKCSYNDALLKQSIEAAVDTLNTCPYPRPKVVQPDFSPEMSELRQIIDGLDGSKASTSGTRGIIDLTLMSEVVDNESLLNRSISTVSSPETIDTNESESLTDLDYERTFLLNPNQQRRQYPIPDYILEEHYDSFAIYIATHFFADEPLASGIVVTSSKPDHKFRVINLTYDESPPVMRAEKVSNPIERRVEAPVQVVPMVIEVPQSEQTPSVTTAAPTVGTRNSPAEILVPSKLGGKAPLKLTLPVEFLNGPGFGITDPITLAKDYLLSIRKQAQMARTFDLNMSYYKI
nr:MAG: phosphoprotein [Lantra virus]